MRKELRAWLRRLHDEVHVTTVIVTHDQEETMEVAGQIVVLKRAGVEQVGSPAIRATSSGSLPAARSTSVTFSSTARRLRRTAIQASRSGSAAPLHSTCSGLRPRTLAAG